VSVKGTPREMGRQHGEACRQQIRHFLEVSLESIGKQKGQSRERLLERTRAFIPHIRAFTPRLVPELEGIAAGAGISFEEAVFLQVRTDLILGDAGCSAVGFLASRTTTGGTIIGQNSDVAGWLKKVGIVLRQEPERGPRFIMFTWAGVIGYPGFNEHGVAFVQNQLYTQGWRPGVPHYPLKRRILESRNVRECLDIIQTTQFSSAGNYVLLDGEGELVDVEIAAPHGTAVLPDDNGAVAHTNNILDPKLQPFDQYKVQLPDSAPRCERAQHFTATHAKVSVADVQQFLSDHANYPHSVCRHHDGTPQSIETVASIVMEPTHGRLHVSWGNPCENAYTTYTLS